MSAIVVGPLAKIAELAVTHKVREMVSLIAEKQDFHRPGVIAANRHLTLKMNDIGHAAKTGELIAPSEAHVETLIGFVKEWDQSAPILIHCWMGVSRSPAAALIATLALDPEQDEAALVRRMRNGAPHVTPNSRLIELGDAALGRGGRLVKAVRAAGRGTETNGSVSFVLPLKPLTSSGIA